MDRRLFTPVEDYRKLGTGSTGRLSLPSSLTDSNLLLLRSKLIGNKPESFV